MEEVAGVQLVECEVGKAFVGEAIPQFGRRDKQGAFSIANDRKVGDDAAGIINGGDVSRIDG